AKPIVILLGRSQLQVEESWLTTLQSEAEIKSALVQHFPSCKSPKEIERAYRSICSNREINANLAQLKDMGVQAFYHSLDIIDSQALSMLCVKVRSTHGEIRGWVHGAGILADRSIVDKDLHAAKTVYQTKILPAQTLLSTLNLSALRLVFLFSSSTARFGRVGQADYAMANEVLNKMAAALQYQHPECLVRSFNWGPWDGGMVTPPLKALFDREGIGLITREDGAQLALQETRPNFSSPQPHLMPPAEIVVLGKHPQDQHTVVTSKVYSYRPSDCTLLQDHVMRDKAVLPAAMMVDAMLQAYPHTARIQRSLCIRDFSIQKAITFPSIHHRADVAIQYSGILDHTPTPIYTPSSNVTLYTRITQNSSVSSSNTESPTVHARAILDFMSNLPAIPKNPMPPNQEYIESPYAKLFHGPSLQSLESITTYTEHH
ncbi:MAG: KR domain-containing protein, partial [Myxococcota bacterium]